MNRFKIKLLVLVGLLAQPCVAQQQEEKEIFLNVNVVPVGPVPLAKFITAKKSAKAIEEETAEGNNEAKEKNEKVAAPVQAGQIIVVETPKDEKPPEAVYYKLGKKYVRLTCNLNAVGKPTRIPIKGEVLKFYTRGENDSDGKPTYNFLFDHAWTAEQESVVFTLTKSLKTKKWKRPLVTAYNVSPNYLNNSKFLIINASQDSKVKIATKEGAKSLRPHAASMHDGDKVIALTIAAIEGNKALPAYKRFFPVRTGQLSLLLVYPVTQAEDYHRLKFIHSRITKDSYKEAVFVR